MLRRELGERNIAERRNEVQTCLRIVGFPRFRGDAVLVILQPCLEKIGDDALTILKPFAAIVLAKNIAFAFFGLRFRYFADADAFLFAEFPLLMGGVLWSYSRYDPACVGIPSCCFTSPKG
jgi:hypothetical protein